MKIGNAWLVFVFACVIFLELLPYRSACALGVDREGDLAPFDQAKDFDLFTISGDFAEQTLLPVFLNPFNKGLQSADVSGFSFVISRDETTVLSNDFLVKAGLMATSADWGDLHSWGPWTAGGYVSHDAGDPPVAWIGALLRTTRNAPAFDDALAIPLRTFVSGDPAETAGTLMLTDLFARLRARRAGEPAGVVRRAGSRGRVLLSGSSFRLRSEPIGAGAHGLPADRRASERRCGHSPDQGRAQFASSLDDAAV